MPRRGDVIGGKYELLRELGRGGMGIVYEAVHVGLGGRVAIKTLSPVYATDREALQRFTREARAAAAVGHEAVIAIHDIGKTDDGLPFMVMELLRGRSLAERLASSGALDMPTAAYVGCQVLSGLAAVHAAGIVHRDLKPANVFLTEGGALVPGVRVLDFGIARLVGLQGITALQVQLTRAGNVIGTPEYMSPEQARGGGEIDHRSDLFSVGVILYEALTGRVPFSGASGLELLSNIIGAPHAPLRELLPAAPAALEAALDRALAKAPADRFASAVDFFAALFPFLAPTALGRVIVPEGFALPQEAPVEPDDFEVDPTADTLLNVAPLEVTGTEPATIDTFRPAVSAARPRRRRVWAVVAVVTVLLGAGAGGLYAVVGRGDAAPPAEHDLVDLIGATAPVAEAGPPQGRLDAGPVAPPAEPTPDAAPRADAAATPDSAAPTEPSAPERPPRVKRRWRPGPQSPSPSPAPPPEDDYEPGILGGT